jgi:very-short-patch-repair endonuclease
MENKSKRYDRTREKTSRARELRQKVSKTEFKLWPDLRNKNLGYSFRRQHPIGPYFADYYCAALKLAIEVDGDWHEAIRDANRDEFFATKGIITHRIPISEVDESVESVVERIAYLMAERQLELGL